MQNEFEYRQTLYNQLLEKGSLEKVDPFLIREMGIYKGQQGIYRDKKRTAPLSPDGTELR